MKRFVCAGGAITCLLGMIGACSDGDHGTGSLSGGDVAPDGAQLGDAPVALDAGPPDSVASFPAFDAASPDGSPSSSSGTLPIADAGFPFPDLTIPPFLDSGLPIFDASLPPMDGNLSFLDVRLPPFDGGFPFFDGSLSLPDVGIAPTGDCAALSACCPNVPAADRPLCEAIAASNVQQICAPLATSIADSGLCH